MAKSKYLLILLVAAVALFGASPLAAMPTVVLDSGVSSGASLVKVLSGLASGLHTFLFILMGLGALASLIVVIYNIMSGREDSAKRFVWLFIALAICSIVLAVLNETLSSLSENSTSYFYQLSGNLSKCLIIIVAMVTLVKHGVGMFQGDTEAYKKILTWLIALVVSIALIDAVMSNSSDFASVNAKAQTSAVLNIN